MMLKLGLVICDFGTFIPAILFWNPRLCFCYSRLQNTRYMTVCYMTTVLTIYLIVLLQFMVESGICKLFIFLCQIKATFYEEDTQGRIVRDVI